MGIVHSNVSNKKFAKYDASIGEIGIFDIKYNLIVSFRIKYEVNQLRFINDFVVAGCDGNKIISIHHKKKMQKTIDGYNVSLWKNFVIYIHNNEIHVCNEMLDTLARFQSLGEIYRLNSGVLTQGLNNLCISYDIDNQILQSCQKINSFGDIFFWNGKHYEITDKNIYEIDQNRVILIANIPRNYRIFNKFIVFIFSEKFVVFDIEKEAFTFQNEGIFIGIYKEKIVYTNLERNCIFSSGKTVKIRKNIYHCEMKDEYLFL